MIPGTGGQAEVLEKRGELRGLMYEAYEREGDVEGLSISLYFIP